MLTSPFRSHSRNTLRTTLPGPTRAAGKRHQRTSPKRDAGGSRTHLKAALQAAAVPSGSSVVQSVSSPGIEPGTDAQRWSRDLRKVACESGTPRGRLPFERPAEELNLVRQFRGLPCIPAHPQGTNQSVSRPGIEPGPEPSESSMRSVTPSGREFQQSRRLDSHQHGSVYKTGAFLRRATSASARARGVEPRGAALETACSPGSTLV